MPGLGILLLILWFFLSRSEGGRRQTFLPLERVVVSRLFWMTLILLSLINLVAIADSDQAVATKLIKLGGAAVVIAALAGPFHLVRQTFSRFGLWRLATFFGWWATIPRAARLSSGARTAGLLAWGARQRTTAVPGFLAALKLKENWPILGAELLDRGLVAALEGHRGQATILMDTVVRLPRRGCDRISRRLALEWLALNAVHSGSWQIASPQPWWPSSRILFFLRQVAVALKEPGSIQLWRLRVGRWLLPGRTAGRLLERARSALPGPKNRSSAELDLHETLKLTAQAVRRPSERAIHQLALDWQWLLGSAELAAWIDERAAALRLDPEVARTQLDEATRNELQAWARSLPFPGIALAFGFSQQESRSSELLIAALAALEAREEQKQEKALLDELEEWVNLRLLFEEAQADGPIEHLNAYRDAVGPLTSWAVWLWNERGQQPLAFAMFSWIYWQALIFDDHNVIEVMSGNLRNLDG